MLLDLGDEDTVALLPPGTLGEVQEPDERQHRWRLAIWRGDSGDPELSEPDEICVLTVGEALERAGPNRRVWVLERTSRQIDSLRAAGRNAVTGELPDERVAGYRLLARTLSDDAMDAVPSPQWLPATALRRRWRWRLIAWLKLRRAAREYWRGPEHGDPDDVPGLPEAGTGESALDHDFTGVLHQQDRDRLLR